MARVLALTRDLMFGSRVQGALSAAGHEVELVDGEARLRELLGDADAPPPPAVMVADLTDPDLDAAAIVQSLAADGMLAATRTLAFYSHVDTVARERAEQAGFDLVVPRSRMAREGAALVAQLL